MLTLYSLEQQASLIADYWLLNHYGYEPWRLGVDTFVKYVGPVENNVKEKYEQVLHDFSHQR